jgi:hypothetical protein
MKFDAINSSRLAIVNDGVKGRRPIGGCRIVVQLGAYRDPAMELTKYVKPYRVTCDKFQLDDVDPGDTLDLDIGKAEAK